MVKIRRSLSKLYLLPLLDIISPVDHNAIVNTYLHDINIKLLKKEKLFVTVRTEYIEVVEKFRDSELYIQEYKPLEIEEFEDDYLCFIIEIPTEFIRDFNLFLEGKYTKFSINAKNKIIEYYKNINDSVAATIEAKLYGYESNRKVIEDYFNLVEFCSEMNKTSVYKTRPIRIKIEGELESKPIVDNKYLSIEIVGIDLYLYYYRLNYIDKEKIESVLNFYDLKLENIITIM